MLRSCSNQVHESMESLKVALLVSGGGTTLKNLLDRQQRGELNLDFRLVISSREGVGGLQHAEAAKIPNHVVRKRDYEDPWQHAEAIFSSCREAQVDYVLMGGFLSHVLIPADFQHRVLNTHPSLIPAFCGKGFYGLRVHQAVLDFGVKISGCTIHFVDDQYDHGPIIHQRSVPVAFDDTAESLARRVFAAECEAYPEVLRQLAAGRVTVEGGRVRVAPMGESR